VLNFFFPSITHLSQTVYYILPLSLYIDTDMDLLLIFIFLKRIFLTLMFLLVDFLLDLFDVTKKDLSICWRGEGGN